MSGRREDDGFGFDAAVGCGVLLLLAGLAAVVVKLWSWALGDWMSW